jgi:hypothetical protein
MKILHLLTCLLLAASITHAVAADAILVPEGGTPLLGSDSVFVLNGISAPMGSLKTQPTKHPGFSQSMLLETRQKPSRVYDLQAQARPPLPVEKGDVVLLVLYARMVATSDESGEGNLGLIVEKAGTPHTKSLERRVRVGGEWKQIVIPFIMADLRSAGCN